MTDLDGLKRDVFFRLLDMAGRVFVVVRHSDRVDVGRRGFLEEEKENGLILVFNQSMNFTWDEAGISATLVFGTAPEKCFIPSEDVISVYSPELNVHLVVTPGEKDEERVGEELESGRKPLKKRPLKEDNVIRVDFKHKG